MYTRKYDISVVCSLPFHKIFFILLMSAFLTTEIFVLLYLQTGFGTLVFNISHRDVLVCFSKPFLDASSLCYCSYIDGFALT